MVEENPVFQGIKKKTHQIWVQNSSVPAKQYRERGRDIMGQFIEQVFQNLLGTF